jgi:hypothetical protein
MISVDSRGRMGNQMFQLAFAHAASRRLNTWFVLGPNRLWEGFDLGPWGRRRVRVARKLALRLRHGREPPERIEVEEQSDPARVLAELRDGVAYGGFFQSERYFAGYEEEIRRLFTVRPEHEAAFAARYTDLRPYVCMHLRRGDLLDPSHRPVALPTSFFLDALEEVPDRDRYPVVVISDDIAGAREELAGLPDARFESNTPMVDLLLLMNASVVVSSNSSFSWWGAWLNRREGALVVAPKHWFGFRKGIELPRDVIASGWMTIPVRDAPHPARPSSSA